MATSPKKLADLNRCAGVSDLVDCLGRWAGPKESVGLYRMDTRGGFLRLIGWRGPAFQGVPQTLHRDMSLAWEAVGTWEPQRANGERAFPLDVGERFSACLVVHGDSLGDLVALLVKDLEATARRAISWDSHLWRAQILEEFGSLSPVNMIAATADGDIVFFGERIEKMLGWTLADVLEHGWTDLVYPDPDYREDMLKGLAAQLQGAEAEGVHRKMTCKDGSVKDVAVWSRSGPSVHGGVPVMVWVHQDVGERLESHREDMRNESLERLGRLSGNIAHDFNNLLCAIIGNADLLLVPGLSQERVHKRGRIILDAGQQGAALARQLLAFGGGGAPMQRILSFGAEVEAVLDLFRPELPPGVSLQFEVEPDLGNIEADRSLLASAVMNLLSNARDAVEGQGSIQVKLAAGAMPENSSHRSPRAPEPRTPCAVLSIRDTGPGFKQSALERLFEPFFTTKAQGHGLGLAAVVGVLDTHFGALVVEKGEGACVRMFLPFSNKPEAAISRQEAGLAGAGRRVWMVDDSAPILEFSQVALTAAGYRVTSFGRGQDAVSAARRLHPDEHPHLLLLDILGEPGGQETLAGLQGVGVDPPVLWATGFAPGLSEVEGQPSRALLKKPFTATQLVDRVGQELGVQED